MPWATELTALAYVNHGVWVADCPAPFCKGAEHYGLREGEVGRMTAAGFSCKRWPDCGWQGPVAWPAERAEIERLLMQRPDPATRNWLPGESMFVLISENVAHGIYPPASIEAASVPLDAQRPDRGGVESSGELNPGDLVSLLFVGDEGPRRLTASATTGGA